MDFQWGTIALDDVTWITLAFILGFLVKQINLPPLIGFLITGFILNYMGISSGETLEKLADLGISLLLFTVGLKLNIKVLIRPQVWAVTLLHLSLIVVIFGAAIFLMTLFSISFFSELDIKTSLMLAFALSFSSTVFVVKTLEDKGEMRSLHGRIAIGILVMQDLAAVTFLAISAGKLPSIWALLLFLLIPLRPLLHHILLKTGHGELLILYGLVLALGGAELFELVGVKGDLGALIFGVLISTHAKSTEIAKSMLGFKDLFLLGFFLTIGMSGQLSIEALIIGIILVPLILFKSTFFFGLMLIFKLRARTALLSTLNLSNYSEFGLIVIAIGVANEWMSSDWLVIMAIALSLSFVIASILNNMDDKLYSQFREHWLKLQRKKRLADDLVLDTHGATIAIFGMGRVGSSAYDKMREYHGETVVGVDFDSYIVNRHQSKGRKVLQGDPSDADFWEQIEKDHSIELVMLSLPNLDANLNALQHLHKINYDGRIAATARFRDEVEILKEAGAHTVFDIYTEAGVGFSNHIEELK